MLKLQRERRVILSASACDSLFLKDHSALSTQHSALSTQHSALSTQHSALGVGVGRSGFSLLEVLVASAIVSLLLAAVYGVFAQTLQTKHRVEDGLSRARSARVVLLRMGEELQSSFSLDRGNTRFVGRTNYDGPGPEASLSFVSLVATSLTGGEAMPSEVQYRLVPDPNRSLLFSLVRWEKSGFEGEASDFPLSSQNPQNTFDHGGQAFPLLFRVRGFRVRFSDGQRWRDTWGDGASRGQLPRAVELALYLDKADEEAVLFSTVVDIPLAGAQYAERL